MVSCDLVWYGLKHIGLRMIWENLADVVLLRMKKQSALELLYELFYICTVRS